MSTLWKLRASIAAFCFSLLLPATALCDPAIWKLSDEDSEIYLFGSVHILRTDVEWRTDQLDALVASADRFYFEADTGPVAQAELVPLISELGTTTPDRPLSTYLTADQNALLAEVASSMGVPAEALEGVRPWLASLTLAMIQLQQSGYTADSGVETVLGAEIEAADKRYFETAEQQIRFFTDMPDDDQVAALVEGLRQMRDEPDMLDGLVNAWAAGDIAEIDVLFNEGMQASGQNFFDILITQRNERWVEQISTEMDGSGTVLIIVGAGHLVGEVGVPTLLEEAGYSVVRVQ